jgi:branched-chain amino acid transport system substrate-binding protein
MISTRRLFALLFLLVALVLTLSSSAWVNPRTTIAAPSGQTEFTIGAILGLTGNAVTLGKTSQAAILSAAQDITKELTAAGSPVTLNVLIADTALAPDQALQATQRLAGQGASVIIGPQTSAELAAVKTWADANNVLVVSNGSTASSLSIRDDNVLRLVPDDSHEIAAVVALLQRDGIKAVVPLWRDDAGNRGLHDALARAFPAAGGVVLDGASYAPNATDYGSQTAAIGSQVQQAQQQYGQNSVAVVLASFEEAAQIFHSVQNDPILSAVHWYGTDGVAQSATILQDPDAVVFAQKVGFPCANLGLDPAARDVYDPLIFKIQDITGAAPDASALAAYDATWLAVQAYLESGSSPSAATLRQSLVSAAGRYFGATGRTLLNENGDRASGDYDFWAIRDQGDGPRWMLTASYRSSPSGPGTIVSP